MRKIRQSCENVYFDARGVANDVVRDLTYIYPLAIPRPTKSTDPGPGARSFTFTAVRSSARRFALTSRNTRALPGHLKEKRITSPSIDL